ncbi:MAG TPA: TIR domain-containing protein, partial [Accumulibacter sp.]|nr:TIR domain-containing protein [Accumulibacter sp.]
MRDLPDQFLVAFSFAGEQRALVQRIAEATEQRLGKATVFFDDWYEHYIAGDDADLRLQEIYGKRSLLALVCVSASYGGKPWTQAEHAAIRSRQMQSRSSPRAADRLAVLPLRVGNGDVPGILFNSIVPDVRQKTIDQVLELIVSRLQLVRGEQPPQPVASGTAYWPDEPLAFEHSLADRTSQWPAIQQVMAAGSRQRILLFKGASGHGKSVLLSTATAYARLLGVLQAYVDFKNTQHLQQANVLRTLRLDIGGA